MVKSKSFSHSLFSFLLFFLVFVFCIFFLHAKLVMDINTLLIQSSIDTQMYKSLYQTNLLLTLFLVVASVLSLVLFLNQNSRLKLFSTTITRIEAALRSFTRGDTSARVDIISNASFKTHCAFYLNLIFKATPEKKSEIGELYLHSKYQDIISYVSTKESLVGMDELKRHFSKQTTSQLKSRLTYLTSKGYLRQNGLMYALID
jgi:hypothetical protein